MIANNTQKNSGNITSYEDSQNDVGGDLELSDTSFSNARKMQKQCTEKEERNDNFLSMRTDSTVNQDESATVKKLFGDFEKRG